MRPPKLPHEPLPSCCVLWRRGFEFGLVGGYPVRQLGALLLQGLPLVPGSWHPGSLPRLEAVELPPKLVFCISAVDELACVRCLPERRISVP
jgi:hypothetical protein